MKKKLFATRVVAGGLCASLIAVGITTTPALAADPPAGELLPLIQAPETVNTFLGQSVQVRKTADGNPNTDLFDPRWTVTQLNAESLNKMNTQVPLPMNPAPGLRSLTGAGHSPEKEDDGVIFNFPQVNGVDTYRTINLYPGDKELPADVKAEFTLNGEQVEAQDLVGKGGVVTATYTVTNNTRKKTPVRYKNLGGKMVTKEMTTDQPMIAIAQQLIPQNWGQVNVGSGIVGADGRGNYQSQWVALPFSPMSDNGTAQFGWTAYVPEGEGFVPNIMINVAPIFIPETGVEKSAKQSKDSSGGGGGIPGAAQISGGIGTAAAGGAELVKGIVGVAESIGAGVGTIKHKLPGAISETKDALGALEKTMGIGQGGGSKMPSLPDVIKTLKRTSANLGKDIAYLKQNGSNADAVKDLQKQLNQANTLVGLMRSTNIDPAYSALKSSKCDGNAISAKCIAYGTNYTLATQSYPVVTKNLQKVQDALSDIADSLPSTVGDIEVGVLETIQDTIDGLTENLEDLQIFLATKLFPEIKALTGALGNVFGAIGAGIDEIKKGVAANSSALSGGASGIGAGIGEIGAGIGALTPAARAFIARIMTLVTAGGKALKAAVSEINGIKATLAGLMSRAHESPLPYGGGQLTVYQPQGAPEVDLNTVSQDILNNNGKVPAEYAQYVQETTGVFGAFQFVFDPANNNKPDTPWRILLGIVAMLIAGIALPILARRKNQSA